MNFLFDLIDNYVKKLGTKLDWKQVVVILLFIVTILMTLPIILASFYNFPCADDFAYAGASYQVVHSGAGFASILINLIRVAFTSMIRQYLSWSGCYSSYFFSAFNPFIFSEQLTFLTTFLLLGIVIAALFFFLFVLFYNCLKMDKQLSTICVLILINISIQFVPYAFDAFYWFNGSFYNTIGYSAALVFMGIILKLLSEDRNKKVIWKCIALVALATFIGGTNYSTMLALSLVLIPFSLDVFTIKPKIVGGGYKLSTKKKFVLLIAIGTFFLFFLISAMAPGNEVRGDYFVQESLIGSITKSFLYAYRQIKQVINVPIFICILVVSIIIFSEIKQKGYQYRYPFVTAVFTYGLYASTFTPVIYAQSVVPSPRLINIQFWFLLLIITFNITYFLGWLYNNCKSFYITIYGKMEIVRRFKKFSSCAIMILLMFVILVFLKYSNKITCTIIVKDFIRGDLQQFSEEMQDRFQIYHDPNIQDVIVAPLTVIPQIFTGYYDISDEATWVGSGIANCYSKKSITMKNIITN